MDEVLEVIPLSIELDAAQLDDCVDALLDPAHAAVVAASADDTLDRTFDLAAAKCHDCSRTRRRQVAHDALCLDHERDQLHARVAVGAHQHVGFALAAAAL